MLGAFGTCTARPEHVFPKGEALPPDERRRRFERLYAANHDRILGFLMRRVTDPQDAADLLGETFLTAWRRLEAVPAGDEARLWLYGVARNLLANHYRGERRRTDLAVRLRADVSAVWAPTASVDTTSGGSMVYEE
jgi:RNA polymerase sigma-70 factor (ECF subfamily)